ncbi:MAG: hypothetical protein AB7Q81_02550 [Gammaproteobacteria bacterium]
MRSPIRSTCSGHCVRIEIPPRTTFDDFRLFRDAILGRPGVKSVVFDFRHAADAPTWLMGFMLHVEERHGLDVRAENVNGTPRRLFELAGLDRLLCPVPKNAQQRAAEVHDVAILP